MGSVPVPERWLPQTPRDVSPGATQPLDILSGHHDLLEVLLAEGKVQITPSPSVRSLLLPHGPGCVCEDMDLVSRQDDAAEEAGEICSARCEKQVTTLRSPSAISVACYVNAFM